MKTTADVIVVGAGHNGLACALLLARKKLDVLVVEEKDMVGGAVKTEYPFKTAPRLGTSTTSTTPSASPIGSPTPRRARGSTRRARGATPRGP